MARGGWHSLRDGATLTVSRACPVRFDLAVETRFDDPGLRRGRIAHQIRQDMWRCLQNTRGFRPAVRVTRTPTGLDVVAGGALDGRVTARMRADLAALLADPVLRRRWIVQARPSRGRAP